MKLTNLGKYNEGELVASRAEAWIETYYNDGYVYKRSCRLPCGGVD